MDGEWDTQVLQANFYSHVIFKFPNFIRFSLAPSGAIQMFYKSYLFSLVLLLKCEYEKSFLIKVELIIESDIELESNSYLWAQTQSINLILILLAIIGTPWNNFSQVFQPLFILDSVAVSLAVHYIFETVLPHSCAVPVE